MHTSYDDTLAGKSSLNLYYIQDAFNGGHILISCIPCGPSYQASCVVCECDTHARKSKGRGSSSEERSEPLCASRFRAGRRGSAFTCIINWTTGVCSYCIWSLPACPKEFWSSFAETGTLSRRCCCCCCRRCSMIPPLASIKVTH